MIKIRFGEVGMTRLLNSGKGLWLKHLAD